MATSYIQCNLTKSYGKLYYRFYPQTLSAVVGFVSRDNKYSVESSIEDMEEYEMIRADKEFTYTTTQDEYGWVAYLFEKHINQYTKVQHEEVKV
jgi:hypothetical protein